MQKISIENGNFINVQIDGDKQLPTVILSNSLGADTRMWDPQVKALKEKFCVIRYDKRGHGKSSPIQGPYSFEMLENDVIRIMDELEIENMQKKNTKKKNIVTNRFNINVPPLLMSA